MKWIFVTAAAVAALVLMRGVGAGELVAPKEARQLVDQHGGLLVDVRTPEEYRSGHLSGAVNIPIAELRERSGELGPKTRPLVLYCAAGVRAARGKSILEGAGYTNVHNLGTAARWKEP